MNKALKHFYWYGYGVAFLMAGHDMPDLGDGNPSARLVGLFVAGLFSWSYPVCKFLSDILG